MKSIFLRTNLYNLFSNIGYNKKVAGILTNLCTYDGHLPQGAVTSPYIANLVCFHMDLRINGYCSKKDIVYTRYADDLTFSSNNRATLNRVEGFIKYIVKDEGFSINEKKTRYLSDDVKKTVTGITINSGSIHIDKIYKRNLRAQIYNSIKLKNYKDNDKIIGKIAFINSIEEGFLEKIKNNITHIIKKPEFISDVDIVNAYNKNKLFDDLPDMIFDSLIE